MNKKIIILVVSIFVLLIGFSVARRALSYQTATITIKPAGVSVTVYDSARHAVARLSNVGEVRLQPGNYTAVPGGGRINTAAIPFEVKDTDARLTIDPGYSATYLASLTTEELPAITAVLTANYPTITSDFTVNTGSLYLYGDWYATTVVQKSPGPGASGDVYRAVLHKQDGTWKVVAGPAIVLSAKESPAVPRSVLDDINHQSGYSP